MDSKGKVAVYLLFGLPGLLIASAFQSEEERAAARKSPFYVESSDSKDEPFVYGFHYFDDAKKHAVRQTVGMYRMNGQLNDNEAKIFEKGGKLVETIISGLTEKEYNEIKAKRENKEEKQVKSVTAFTWNPSK